MDKKLFSILIYDMSTTEYNFFSFKISNKNIHKNILENQDRKLINTKSVGSKINK